MSLNLNTKIVRFDRRLLARNLREGRISLDELNAYLAELEDVSHLVASPDTSAPDTGVDDEDEYEDEDDDEDEE